MTRIHRDLSGDAGNFGRIIRDFPRFGRQTQLDLSAGVGGQTTGRVQCPEQIARLARQLEDAERGR